MSHSRHIDRLKTLVISPLYERIDLTQHQLIVRSLRMRTRRLETSCITILGLTLVACSVQAPRQVLGGDGGTADAQDSGQVTVDVYQPPKDVPPPKPLPPVIWAHSAHELFNFNPDTRKVTVVGTFTLDGEPYKPSITDLAVDKDRNAFVVSRKGIFSLDTETVALTHVTDAGVGFALSFLHEDVPGIFNRKEELLTENDGDLAIVDTETGKLEVVLNIPKAVGEDCRTSGDIVSVTDLGTYVTLRCKSDNEVDFLGKIDFDAQKIEMVGRVMAPDGTPFRSIFGLGFWSETLYGFTRDGELVAISLVDARAELISNDTGAEQFYGAGVTTQAPVVVD